MLEVIERDPVAFLTGELQPRLDQARQVLAQLVGASVEQLAFVPSTTYGLNELLQRLELPAGSEVLLPDHGYNATVNLVRFACAQRGWTCRLVPIPLPLEHPAQVVAAFAAAWSPATRLLVVDHITSPTALVLPIQQLIALARERDGRIVVDGAHGPGSLPLELEVWQPDAYVGNLHKWLCCPRGAAFLWVRDPWQLSLRPLVVGHGANAPLPLDTRASGASRFHLEHDWLGTADPTPWLALPEALRLLGGRGGLERLMQANHHLAQQGQALLLEALRQAGFDAFALAPAAAQVGMAAVPLPTTDLLDGPALQRALRSQGFQLPVIPMQPHHQRMAQFLRISCFAYNSFSDLEALADVLPAALAATAV
jgi:isopenicillin-N epimerase